MVLDEDIADENLGFKVFNLVLDTITYLAVYEIEK
jgi:hypothetical protein